MNPSDRNEKLVSADAISDKLMTVFFCDLLKFLFSVDSIYIDKCDWRKSISIRYELWGWAPGRARGREYLSMGP